MDLASLAACLISLQLPQERMELTILHTNDIHGHVHGWSGWEGDLLGKTLGGFDRLASVVESVRKETTNVLLLDAGDAIGDTQIAVSTRGAAIIDLMNHVGYDAMVIGNHEPDYGMSTLRHRMRQARFPVLAANIVDSASGRLFTKPYAIREVGGQKIGILGLAYPNTPKTTSRKNVAGFEFLQAKEAASKYVPEMRSAGAAIVIVLSHLGLSADRSLAEEVDGIDVIVGGHSHNRMSQPLRAGTTLVVQAGAHLSDVGRLNLTISKGQITSFPRKFDNPRSFLNSSESASCPAHAALHGGPAAHRRRRGPVDQGSDARRERASRARRRVAGRLIVCGSGARPHWRRHRLLARSGIWCRNTGRTHPGRRIAQSHPT